jgi:uncharacterized protein YprB with RNaseH-like and TPR domain
MRDLTARLRDIVAREGRRPAASRPVARELTYVPDFGDGDTIAIPATMTGAVPIDEGAACLQIDHRYDASLSHGRRAVQSYRPNPQAPVGLFDTRLAAVSDWAQRVVFFDIETTGLSGGAGTLAFLTGCGWFDGDGGFTVRQFFLAAPAGERPMLEALGRIFDEASLVVTFNGRTFDVPFMETRWAFHRSAAPTDDLPHFDMLPPARRFWGRRVGRAGTGEGCNLTALERRVLGFHRYGDVPGFEIPARYFQFLRTGESTLVEGVLEHNRHDLMSLAAVMSHALWLAQEGPEACRESSEQLALGHVYERGGDAARAEMAYEMAARQGDADVRRAAWYRLALMHRRARRFDDAAWAWQQIVDLIPPGRRALSPLERQAVEALAIHNEHRARDLERAREYAETLGMVATGRSAAETDRRLSRIRRKMAGRLDL